MSVNDEIPKSRLTLTYKTTVTGELEEVNLPLRLLLLGDYSLGSSDDRKVDLDEREIRNINGSNLNEVINNMNMKVNMTVPNKIDPDNAEELEVEIPLNNGMKSFSPDNVAKEIPKIKGMLMLKKLLLEMQSNMDNRKEFRKLLAELAKDQEAVKGLLGELKDFTSYKLPGDAS